jgi:hypothetical protein
MAAWETGTDPTARQVVIDRLRAVPEGDARADVLRLTFLARATRDSRYEDAAAARVLAIEPEDPDRLAAFMAFRWLSALQDLDGRSDFLAALSGGRLPEMAGRLKRSASACRGCPLKLAALRWWSPMSATSSTRPA